MSNELAAALAEMNVADDAQSDPAATAAPEKAEVETPAPEAEKPEEATTDDGKKPEAAQTDAEREASEAGKKLNQHKQSAKERVQQAIARQREAERRAESLAREVETLRERLQKEPAETDYEDASQLTAARVEHALDKRDAERLSAERDEAAKAAEAAAREVFREHAEEFAALHEDFGDVIGRAPISEQTATFVVELGEDGPAVAYWLGKPENRNEAKRIEALPPRARMTELAKISGRLSSPPPRKISAAPDPINPVKGKNAGGPFDPEKASVADFAKMLKLD